MPDEPLVPIVTVAGLAIVINLFALRQLRRNPTIDATRPRPPLRRPKGNFGRAVLVWQLYMLALALYFAHSKWIDPPSVGLSIDIAWPWALAIGFVCYAAFFVAYEQALRRTPWYGHLENHTMRNLAAIWPRDGQSQIAVGIAFFVLNPVVEEIMFRGILVYQLGLVTGAVPFAIAVGLAANLLNHAYQGKSSLAFHALFYAMTVALLYSPTGIWGSIGCHFAGDWAPFLLMRQGLAKYRKRHQRDRGAIDLPPMASISAFIA